MFTDGDLACARAIREQVEIGHGTAFTIRLYFWQLMLRAVTSEFYLSGSIPRDLYQPGGLSRFS